MPAQRIEAAVAAAGQSGGLRERQLQETRESIRSTAMGLFEEQGIDQTTVDEIARRSGVSPRTVFRYFPSKRSLLLDFERTLDEAFREAIRAAPPATLTLDAVEHVLLRWAEVLQKERTSVLQRQRIIEASDELSTYTLESLQAHSEHIESELARLWPKASDRVERLALTWLINAVLVVAFSEWIKPSSKGSMARHTREAIRKIRIAATPVSYSD
jgi:AcrR family transcriptional regulator